jgi:hypothetical protein
MTRITNDDYKPSLLDEEALEHYGIKGMKWGVRRDRSVLDRQAGRTSGPKLDKAADQIKKRDKRITEARKTVQADKVAVNKARMKVIKTRFNEGRKAAVAIKKGELKDLKVKKIMNPDRIDAAKMKSGEMSLNLLFNGPVVTTQMLIGQIEAQFVIKRQQESMQKKLDRKKANA